MKYTKRSFPNQQVCVEVTVEKFGTPFMAWVDDLQALEKLDDSLDKSQVITELSTLGYSIIDRPYKNGLWTFWLERNSAVHVGQQEW